MSEKIYQLGAIGLCDTPGIGGDIIGLGQTTPGENFSKVDHVFIVTKSGTINVAEITEAQGEGIITRPLNVYASRITAGIVRVANPKMMPDGCFAPEQIDIVVGAARDCIGQKYGFLWFVACGWDWATTWATFGRVKCEYFRRQWTVREKLGCSQLVAKAYSRILYAFLGKRWQVVEPDDIDDNIKSKPMEWELV